MKTTAEERASVLHVTPALIEAGHKAGRWDNDFVLRLAQDIEDLLLRIEAIHQAQDEEAGYRKPTIQ